jgi:hypothetical protein
VDRTTGGLTGEKALNNLASSLGLMMNEKSRLSPTYLLGSAALILVGAVFAAISGSVVGAVALSVVALVAGIIGFRRLTTRLELVTGNVRQ